MTPKKYIDWVLTEEKPKTDVFTVFSKSSLIELAEIKWYPRWRQYCIIIGDTVWSEGCWDELGAFLRQAKQIYKDRKIQGSIRPTTEVDENASM